MVIRFRVVGVMKYKMCREFGILFDIEEGLINDSFFFFL